MADLNRVKKASARDPCVAALSPTAHVPSQELKECSKDAVVQVELVSESNLLHWKGTIKGPDGTPYEGGTFIVDINLPGDYPFVPPKVRLPRTHAGGAC